MARLAQSGKATAYSVCSTHWPGAGEANGGLGKPGLGAGGPGLSAGKPGPGVGSLGAGGCGGTSQSAKAKATTTA